MMSFSMTGITELQANLDGLVRQTPEQMAAALLQVAEEIMSEAKDLAPVYTGPPRKGIVPGALRASGHVAPAEVTADEVSVQLGFGGPSAPYALVQHERTDFHHTIGQAKYLETPLKAHAPIAAQRMRERLDAFIAQYALGKSMAADVEGET